MQEDHKLEENHILQFAQLSLFDEDPLQPDISILEPEAQNHNHTLHLFQQQELLSEIHFRVHMQSDRKKVRSSYELVITSYRLILFQIMHLREGNSEDNSSKISSKPSNSLPYGFIEQVDIVKREIVICMKTGIIYRIKPYSELNNVYQIILYGFTYLPFFTKQITEQEDSSCYDCLAELERMRIPWQNHIIIPNLNGKLSPTYPKYFIIAKTITQNLLEQCLKIRNYGRVPVLTYFSCTYNAGLWRAARPKINQQHNKYNKAYIKQISKNLAVIDLRDEEVSVKEREPKGEIIFRRFQSITAIHDLLKKIMIAYAKNQTIFKVIGRWFEDVSQLISTAYFVIENLKRGKQVLLQQNSGFDRVTQVSALVALILDPFFRTIHGFSLLIEKEFVSFGHPFGRRLGFEREKITQSSPIFIQFLQCVNQLLVTHPECFQFSSFYLARIGYEAYSTKYNNFFYNTQKQKLNSKIALKTPSIWKMPMRKEFYNYQWSEKKAIKPLNEIRRQPSIKEFIIWREYFDILVDMACECPDQINVKQRRSSLYKMLHRRDSKES